MSEIQTKEFGDWAVVFWKKGSKTLHIAQNQGDPGTTDFWMVGTTTRQFDYESGWLPNKEWESAIKGHFSKDKAIQMAKERAEKSLKIKENKMARRLTEEEVFDFYLKDPSKRKFTLKRLSTFSRASDEQKAQFEEEFKNELRNRFGEIVNLDKIDFSFTGGFFDGDRNPRIGYIQFYLKPVENPDPAYFKNESFGDDGKYYTEGNQAFADEITAIAEECLVKVFHKDPADDNFYALPRKIKDYSQLQTIDFYEVQDADMEDRYRLGKKDPEFYEEFTQPLLQCGVEKIGKVLDAEAQSRGWNDWDEFLNSKKFKAWSEKQYDRYHETPFIGGVRKEDLASYVIYRNFKYGWAKDKTIEELKDHIMRDMNSTAISIKDNRRYNIWYHTALPTKPVPKPASERKPRTPNPANVGKKYYVRFEYSESGEYWNDKYGPYTAKEALNQYEGLKKEYKYAMSQGTVAITLENRMGRELQPNELKESKISSKKLTESKVILHFDLEDGTHKALPFDSTQAAMEYMDSDDFPVGEWVGDYELEYVKETKPADDEGYEFQVLEPEDIEKLNELVKEIKDHNEDGWCDWVDYAVKVGRKYLGDSLARYGEGEYTPFEDLIDECETFVYYRTTVVDKLLNKRLALQKELEQMKESTNLKERRIESGELNGVEDYLYVIRSAGLQYIEGEKTKKGATPVVIKLTNGEARLRIFESGNYTMFTDFMGWEGLTAEEFADDLKDLLSFRG